MILLLDIYSFALGSAARGQLQKVDNILHTKLQSKTARAAALQKRILIFVVVFPLPMILKAAATMIINSRI